MPFLAPLFLIGGLAVALPVVFHLIRRTSRDRVPFSSLMFLLPSPPRVTRRSRLEHLWLLLLRCLVLVLLAAGFSRPFFSKPVGETAAGPRARKTVLLLDTSASMRRPGVWPMAAAKVDQLIGQIRPEDSLAIISFDSAPRTRLTFQQWQTAAAANRITLARQTLAGLQPSWGGTHLGSALISAAESLQEPGRGETKPDDRIEQEILVVSDFQEGSRLDGLPNFEWPKGIEVKLETIKPSDPNNAGLEWLNRQEDANTKNSTNTPAVRVVNARNSKKEQFQIGWLPADAKSFVGPMEEVYVPPGQSRTVRIPKKPAANAELRLGLAGDNADFDNFLYWIEGKPQQIELAFFGRDRETDPNQSLYFLKRAFQETSTRAIQIKTHLPESPVSSLELAQTPLVVVTDVLAEPQTTALRQYLENGGTVLCVLTNAVAVPALARMTGLATLGAEEVTAQPYVILGQLAFEHPLLAPFADPRYSDFSKIHFWKFRRLALNNLPANVEILARFDNERTDPFLLQWSVGRGRVLTMTSGWTPTDSQLALSSKFVPLLYSLLDQNLKTPPPQPAYSVGDEVPLPANLIKTSVTVRKPDGKLIEAPASKAFQETDIPGIYTAQTTPPFAFAVNVPPEESRTGPMELEQIQRLSSVKAKLGSHAQTPRQRERLLAAEVESRQKFWRWLILGALAFLLIESWLAGRLSRAVAE